MKKRICKIGKVTLGQNNPVAVQTMIKSSYQEKKKLNQEIGLIKKAGCEILRIAVEKEKDAEIISWVKQKSGLPLEADIHFDWRLGVLAIEKGADGIRLNPMNIKNHKSVRAVAKYAVEKKCSLRVGINSGGFKKAKNPQAFARLMVNKVADYLAVLEKEKLFNIMLSFKAADVNTTVLANRLAYKTFPYPLHIGVTATGPWQEGLIKSSIGLGILLAEGIGDTLRVSLNAPSWQEVEVAKAILQSLGRRKFSPEIISCPTCSRCKINLQSKVEDFKKRLLRLNLDMRAKELKIALMGCVVNGPGEASQSDLGIAFGLKKAALFKNGKVVKKADAKVLENELVALIREEYGREAN